MKNYQAGYCWYCHWGWAKPVAEIYKKALAKLNGDSSPLSFGPAHVVWADENWDFAESCLENYDKWVKEYNDDERFSDDDLKVVRWSLEELVKIPLKDREIEPEDYDGKHPENYPPLVEVEKV